MKINSIQQPQKIQNFCSAPGGINIQYPQKGRNYTLFDKEKVDFLISRKEKALPYLKVILATSDNEKEIVEALYIVDRLIDAGTKGIPAMYPILSRFNNTQSPHIQVFLAGIYRKTQVPDGFGPLVSMLIKNSQGQKQNQIFDPNEEIGGAILAYIENYAQGPKKIDYSA